MNNILEFAARKDLEILTMTFDGKIVEIAL